MQEAGLGLGFSLHLAPVAYCHLGQAPRLSLHRAEDRAKGLEDPSWVALGKSLNLSEPQLLPLQKSKCDSTCLLRPLWE